MRTRLKFLSSQPVVAGLNRSGQIGDDSWPRFIRTTDILGPRKLDDSIVRFDPALVGNFDVQRDDILVTRTGSIGTVYRHTSDDPACFAGYLVRIRPDLSVADPRFLEYFLQSPDALAQMRLGTIKSTIENFNATKIGNLRIPDLDLACQRSIADSLDRLCPPIDESLVLRKQQVSLVGQWTKAELADAFVDLPHDHRLGQMAEFRSGGTPPKGEAGYWAGAFPWASTKDLRNRELHDTQDHVTPDAARRFSRVTPGGSLLISTRGMSLAHRLPMSRATVDMAFNQDLKALVPRDGVHAQFLQLAIEANERRVLASVVESAHGTKRLQTDDLKALRLPLPPLDRQETITRRWHERSRMAHEVIEKLNASISVLNRYKAALIAETIERSGAKPLGAQISAQTNGRAA